MTKIYKLLIEGELFPKGTIAVKNNGSYEIYVNNQPIFDDLEIFQVENRPHIWELQEEKLDLRSPEAEKMREEARSKRWEFIPKDNEGYYTICIDDGTTDVYIYNRTRDTVDIALWNIGNCHRTKAEALVWGEKYARYFLTK